MIRVLYLIKSHANYIDRRNTQEETWLKDISKGSRYIYCLGDGHITTPTLNGNTLYLKHFDRYNYLSMKMKKILSFVEDNINYDDYDCIVTMDDDVVVDIKKFHKFISNEKPDYFGNTWDGNELGHISGMFVGHSPRLFKIMCGLAKNVQDEGPEDLHISRELRRYFANGGNNKSDYNIITNQDMFIPYDRDIYPTTIAAEIRPFSVDKMKNSILLQDKPVKSKRQLPIVHVDAFAYGGFFNILNTLVSSRILFGSDFKLLWHISDHMPHSFNELFRDIPIKVIESKDQFYNYNTCPDNGPYSYYYIPNDLNTNRKEVIRWYKYFISNLKFPIDRIDTTDVCGIHYRGFHHTSKVDPPTFAEWCVTQLKQMDYIKCYLVADKQTDLIAGILEDNGIEVIRGLAGDMKYDMDRTDLSDLKKFINDGVILCDCETILVSMEESTVTDMGRFFERNIKSHSGSRENLNCWISNLKSV